MLGLLYCEIYKSCWHGCVACWLVRTTFVIALAFFAAVILS